MYYKEENGRIIFSKCKAIVLNGLWISNPSAEQIAEAGGLVYVAPEPEEPVITPQTEPDYDQLLEAIKTMLNKDMENMTDEEALSVAALFPTGKSRLDENKEVVAGERLWYDGKLYKVVTTHVPQADGTPDINKALFTEVSIVEYPDGIQPTGAQDAYNIGDKVSHNDKHGVSDYNGNVGEPGVYGWTEE